MYLFNITVLAEEEIHNEIKAWILQEFFPEIKKHNIFQSQALLRVINSPNEGVTYSLQFQAEDESQIAVFQKELFTVLLQKAHNEYAGKLHFFDSILEYQS